MRANASYINSTKGTSSLMCIHQRMDLQFEFMYLIFTRMPSERYRRRFRSLLLCSCDIVRALTDCFCLLILHKRLWPYSVQIVTCTGNSLSVALLVRPQQLKRDSRTVLKGTHTFHSIMGRFSTFSIAKQYDLHTTRRKLKTS